MTKLLHDFLLNGILTVPGIKQYCKFMRSEFPFPPGTLRIIQLPCTYATNDHTQSSRDYSPQRAI